MSKVKAKNFEYQSKKKAEEETPRKSNKVFYIVLALICAFLVCFVALVCVEKSMENKIIVDNRSSHNISKLTFWYEAEEGEVTDIMEFSNVGSKEKRTESTEELALSELTGEAWLSVLIEFETGEESLIQTGQFLYDFGGKISFELEDTKDEDLMVRLKAGEGLFNSSARTGCDDVYYINPADGNVQ